MWANSALGNESEEEVSIALDTMDNCYMAGGFAGSYVQFGSIVLTNSSLSGSADLFLTKFQAYSVGVHETTVNDIKIFPNPVSDYFWLNSNSLSSTGTIEITLYNTLGMQVLHKNLYDNFNANKVECKYLAPGIYSLIIIKGGTVFRGRVVKE